MACAISAPVWDELTHGCRRLAAGKRRAAFEAYLEDVSRQSFPILPYDEVAATWHGLERARLETLGQPAPYIDGQIAAIAPVHPSCWSQPIPRTSVVSKVSRSWIGRGPSVAAMSVKSFRDLIGPTASIGGGAKRRPVHARHRHSVSWPGSHRGRHLDEYPLEPRVRRDLLIAVTDGDLAAEEGLVDPCTASSPSGPRGRIRSSSGVPEPIQPEKRIRVLVLEDEPGRHLSEGRSHLEAVPGTTTDRPGNGRAHQRVFGKECPD